MNDSGSKIRDIDTWIDADALAAYKGGSYEDATNIWVSRVTIARTIISNKKKGSEQLGDEYFEFLKQPIKTFKEYLWHMFPSEELVNEILDLADDNRIRAHDDLVQEYNDMAKREEITAQRVLDLWGRVAKILVPWWED